MLTVSLRVGASSRLAAGQEGISHEIPRFGESYPARMAVDEVRAPYHRDLRVDCTGAL
jgi:hypothetical protein